MFWNSVIAGLKVLTFWETYVAGLEYLAIFFAPLIVVGIIMEKNEGAAGVAGCFTMLFMPVLQVAAMVVMILSIAPIIFGFADDAMWSFPWKLMTLAPGTFFKLIGILVVVAIALAFVPIFGQLQSLQTLILGGIALAFVLGILDSVNPGIIKGRVVFIPGLWFSAGLIIIGGIMSWVGMMVAALIVTGIEMATEEGIGQLIMFPIGAIFGFIPLFMYGAWLGAQVTG